LKQHVQATPEEVMIRGGVIQREQLGKLQEANEAAMRRKLPRKKRVQKGGTFTAHDEIAVVPCAQDEVPQTPVTPVTAEALIPLHNLIKEDARTLDEVSQRRLQRHVQKLASAARVSFAECAPLQDQNQSLIKINKEAKVRRSTRSLVLGKAKVMSYEDLEEARAKRAAKEKTTLGKAKGTRGARAGVLRRRQARFSQMLM
jgi:hypothetical protein